MVNILPSFFKQRKPRQFNYKPMYYDERKEHLENRVKSIEREMSRESTEFSDSDLRLRIRAERDARHHRPRGKSSLRIVIIFLILLALSYLFLRA